MKKALYKFHFDCGKNGKLYGLFLADENKVKELIESKRNIYFGQVLGEKSEVMGPIEENDLTFITNDEKVIAVVEYYDMENGFNPFDYDIVNDDDLKDSDDT